MMQRIVDKAGSSEINVSVTDDSVVLIFMAQMEQALVCVLEIDVFEEKLCLEEITLESV